MNDDLLDIFLEEAVELTSRAQEDLDALEARPGDAARLDSLFRAIHTLKGSVGFFDWPFFAQMLHAAEDVLGAVRSGDISLGAQSAQALSACLGLTESWLDLLGAERAISPRSAARAAPVTRTLVDILRERQDPRDDNRDVVSKLLARATARGEDLAAPLFTVSFTPGRESYFAGQDPVALARAAPGLLDLLVTEREAWTSLDDYDPFACNLQIDLLSNAAQEALEAAFSAVSGRVEIMPVDAPDAEPQDDGTAAVSSDRRSLRVDIDRIDALAHALDELVVAKNALSQLAAGARSRSVEDLARDIGDQQAAIGRLTTRMHAAVTSMRLVPIAPVLRRLPRTARDLAARLGKAVDVALDCEEVEADKAIVDGLSEPLLHIMRNAIDHGVETPDARRAAGKPERGRITLSARRSGDHVLISIADDGRGIDPARIRAVARERRLLTAEQLDELDNAAVLDVIFRPGFSTAREVSDISGRGVGMDAVRTAVGKLGGRAEVASTAGSGTCITLTLPLSMVLTQIAVVACDDDVYGVPMQDIVEFARVPRDQIAAVRHGHAFVLRGKPVPLAPLAGLLGRPEPDDDADLRVLVVRVGDDWIGVSVQRLVMRMEAVVSHAGGLLTGMPGFAGTTIMGDGSVLIILDLPELLA